MNLKEEDFPFYQLIVKNGLEGYQNAMRDFHEAQEGGLDAQYHFALTIARNVLMGPMTSMIPGFGEEEKQKTLRSCLAIIDEKANTGDEEACKAARGMRDNFIDFSYEDKPEPPAPPQARLKAGKKFNL